MNVTRAPLATDSLYWRSVAGGAAVGIVGNAIVVNLYYAIITPDDWIQAIPLALMWGAVLGLITTAFVLLGTIAFRRTFTERKGLVIALSAVSPLLGWTLFGVLVGLSGDWLFFIAYPAVGFASGVAAGIIAAIVALLVSGNNASGSDHDEGNAEIVRSLFPPSSSRSTSD